MFTTRVPNYLYIIAISVVLAFDTAYFQCHGKNF